MHNKSKHKVYIENNIDINEKLMKKNQEESLDSEGEIKTDPISFREKNAMMDILKEKKAKFSFSTLDIIRSII